MAWIKRNLFFVIGSVVALGLLAAAGVYIYQGLDRNTKADHDLGEIVGTLKNLAQQKPSPGNEKINNSTIAKAQEQQLKAWKKSVGIYFQPITPIPTENPVQSETYAAELRRTVDQLQHQADDAAVALPPKYDFSFTAQRPLVKFAPDSLEALSVQLGEVKTICGILFAARINALDGIKRARVSADDASGPESDYLEQAATTNELAITTPYTVIFRSFTPELSRVIAGFATCSNAFIVKSVTISSTGSAAAQNPQASPMPPGWGQPPMAPPIQPAPISAAAAKTGLTTILKEQLLRITLELRLVKLLPKS